MLQVELVERCKANDRKAQMVLYRKYAEGMFCVAMRFLRNEHDAEDVLQEAFIKAFQRIEQYKGEVSFGAWLKRIVVNGSIDFLKAKKIRTIELDESYMRLAEEKEDWKVSEAISLEEARSAIDQLPEKYKYVVQLFLVEGYDHAEISEILKITETTSRTRLLRGKAFVKEMLKNKSYGTGS
ncbi:RNA polymerase sigma factor [Allomuricauda sp. SCSIO 65647]|uniref:RNA polymerase sigma factor n=1 Tax=Allomuricauda sp. SCSIO 65647 TaxID=2908843 RepID=UPI001F2B5F68|nr:sigma-70 family RNA polymerase sigma factor [Muricauda sp. SCSIO 65647]UJH66848.1 sigma-70 family RNA polymerase sigma factor [Muricauda sp. SCSIO 65647]